MFSCLLFVCLLVGNLEDKKASLLFDVSTHEFVVSPSGRILEGVRGRVCSTNATISLIRINEHMKIESKVEVKKPCSDTLISFFCKMYHFSQGCCKYDW